ncbi:hypothetical protein R3P38DRAFT_496855 [Favolaschia claudopus]|uniref:Uncharacterized protein n=1 Tax=Favolaschia claudopus TaxID=2862362 RepID=A0AAW0CQN5_9AGAR
MYFDDGQSEAPGGILSSSHVTTVNVSGGVGGPGGRGGQGGGGAGGNGEGPRLFFSGAVINVRADHLNDSRNQGSLVDSNFRRIPWGDVYLQRQLYVDGPRSNQTLVSCSASVDWQRCSVRIVHSAKIDGRAFTVATYPDDNAEREWKQDVERYMDIRHENILQLYGTVRCRDIYAVVFHGDSIDFEEYLGLYQDSPILTCYIHAYADHVNISVADYLYSTFDHHQDSNIDYNEELPNSDMLVNRSTGRISIDLGGDSALILNRIVDLSNLAREPLLVSPMEILSSTNYTCVLKTMTLEQCHTNTWDYLGKNSWYRVASSTASMHLGGVYCAAGDGRSLQAVALRHPCSYNGSERSLKPQTTISHDHDCGWRRISYAELNEHPQLVLKYHFSANHSMEDWLSQANHIFGRLGVNSHFHRYVFVKHISVIAKLRRSRKRCNTSPQGYLFVCPSKDFLTGPASFKLPECPWYWSLDPFGGEQLSEEKATELGFPTFYPRTRISARSWDEFAMWQFGWKSLYLNYFRIRSPFLWKN